MIIFTYSNIDIIQGVIGYGNVSEGITDWQITNTSTGIFNILNSSSIIRPSGGTSEIGEISGSTDRYMIFTAGTSTFTVPSGGIVCDILLVGGGGGGGYSYVGGGGGGGGYVYLQSINFPSDTYTVNVGSGGSAGINGASPAGWGGNGGNSSITGGVNYTALGGGGGAGGSASGTITGIGNNGGSGGGGSYRLIGSVAAAGGTSTQFSTYGYGTGGNGNSYGSPWQYGGGGGGASGVIQTVNNAAGNHGLSNSITGSSITYAGGGAGGHDYEYVFQGGSGGGGNGGNGLGTIISPTAGSDGFGGGGGGARGNGIGTAAKGGSGIVIIRYRTANISIIDNGNVGIGTIPLTSSSLLEVVGDVNIIGNYKRNNVDVINATSNYVLSTSNILVSSILTNIRNTSNYVSTINTSLNTRINDTSNYMLTTSNILANLSSSQWTSTSSGIYYNTPISTPITLPNEIGVEKYMVFTYTGDTISGSGQTQYIINIPTGGVVCDILMVGGGGAGGAFIGPGGGGGSVLYGTNINIPSGAYTINVGKGGTSANTKGFNTEGFGATLLGGGCALASFYATALSNSGGSGSGGQSEASTFKSGGSVGTSTKGTILNNALLYNGNIGGSGVAQGPAPQQAVSSGGGGGAGSAGQVGTADNTQRSAGGNGVLVNITGVNLYWGAGGGGGSYNTSSGNGGLGGGGGGVIYSYGYTGTTGTVGGSAYSYAVNPINAGNGTGSGGGGGDNGGIGGSGIIIIKYFSIQQTIQKSISSSLIVSPTVTTGITTGTIGANDGYMMFTYTTDNTGLGQTRYALNITQNIICDILIVGGGGGGARRFGGGGGAGALIYNTSVQLPVGTYYIHVGNGGTGNARAGNLTDTGNTVDNKRAQNGFDSEIIYVQNTSTTPVTVYRAKGGGGGLGGNSATSTTVFPNEFSPLTGGSGGGNGGKDGSAGGLLSILNIVNGSSVTVVNNIASDSVNPSYVGGKCFGNEGGRGGGDSPWLGSGGGGAGSRGTDVNTLGNATANNFAGVGGIGLQYSITGTAVYYAGGGGGGNWDTSGSAFYNDGGLGGGGRSSTKTVAPIAGAPNTGGGGGGDGADIFSGANGGSGVVIIKYYSIQQTLQQYITSSPVTTPTAITGITTETTNSLITTFRTTDSYMMFTYTTETAGAGTGQTLYTINVPTTITCDILVVGGGGGGGSGIYENGGGGAGGILYMVKKTFVSGTYNVIVGNGGVAGAVGKDSSIKQNNTPISFDGISIVGKGGGNAGVTGGNGGSGGGGNYQYGYTDNYGIATQGNTFWDGTTYVPGGFNGEKGGRYSGGSGGGTAEAGGADFSLKGGDGRAVSITGTSVFYGGGGGGAEYGGGTQGGNGGGGSGGTYGNGIPGTPNTGGGGGGSDRSYSGSNGGSGVVIIKYSGIYQTIQQYITSTPAITTNVVAGITTDSLITTFGTTDSYMIFSYTIDNTGSGQTQYTINIKENIVCDILIVGGGGGGGKFGGGGGGGSILFGTNIALNSGSCSIRVGDGGAGDATADDTTDGINGFDSSIIINSFQYIAKGGGGGGSRGVSSGGRNGVAGGSGGGGSGTNVTTNVGYGGISNKNTYDIFQSFGNNGGQGKPDLTGSPVFSSGGGGGAGSVGSNFSTTTGGGNGGTGKDFITYFGTTVGDNGWFGGGGGGNTYSDAGTRSFGNGGSGLFGGGGRGGFESTTAELSAENGLSNTGGGGGGSIWDGVGGGVGIFGGKGGSGIVIIRYRKNTTTAYVGLGTTNPVSELHVYDDTVNNTKLTVQNNYIEPVVVTPNTGYTISETLESNIYYRTLTFAYSPNYPENPPNATLLAWYRLNGDGLDYTPWATKYNLTANVGTSTYSSGTTDDSFFQGRRYVNTASGSLKTSLSLSSRTFSVAVWQRRKNSDRALFVAQGTVFGTNTTVLLGCEGNNSYLIAFHYNDLGSPSFPSDVNTWVHIVYVVLPNNNRRIYRNGVLIATDANGAATNASGDLRFGAGYVGNESLNIDFSDLRIYNNGLSNTDVEKLYYSYTTSLITDNYGINFTNTLGLTVNGTSKTVKGLYNISTGHINSSMLPIEGQTDIPLASTATTTVTIKYPYNTPFPILPNEISASVEKIIVFTYTGDTISGSGQTQYTITVPVGGVICDILIVGGGGGGGNYGGGGGGGDVIVKFNYLLNSGTYTVYVGTGGTGGVGSYNRGNSGKTSSITSGTIPTFLGLFAAGGGGGGSYNQTPDTTPTAGSVLNNNYSSGGGGGGGSGGIGGGNSGGTGNSISGDGGSNNSQTKGGGGGGAVGNGVSATSNGGGNGGSGLSSSISKTTINYGGGGGGGSWTGGTFGIGVDGGGNGTVEGNGIYPVSGTANRGGGGGGGGGSTGINNQNGANGGSGIIIIRYSTFQQIIEITSSPQITGITKGIIGTTDRTISFTYTSDNSETIGQTLYTFTPTQNIVCDILVVGGGGGGGKGGGGGGGGGILFGVNFKLNSGSSVSVKVGNGGTGATTNDNGVNGINGNDSSITINSIEYIAKGGGGGGTRGVNAVGTSGNAGGCGGGGSHANSAPQGQGGVSNKNNYANFQSFGNSGGLGKLGTSAPEPSHASGGGGGAGSVGNNATGSGTGKGGGDGGFGKEFIAYFGRSVGHNGYFAGGGGGNTYSNAGIRGYGNGGLELYGGGGNAGFDGTMAYFADNGMPNTGGGGGGAFFSTYSYNSNFGGNGGSGFVIIRYRINTMQTSSIELNRTVVPPNEIVVAGTTSTTIGQFDRLISFPYTSDSTGLVGQTQYIFTTTEPLICDILIVGGGGGGSGAGGGGGGYVYNTNIILEPNILYTVSVGNGGTGSLFSGYANYQSGNQGYNSSIIGGTINLIAYGGGGGGANAAAAPAHTNGQVGSYGGTGMDFNQVQTYTSTQGNAGGNSIRFINYGSGGGGGGAGAIGGTAYYVSGLYADSGNTISYSNGGIGGNGLPNSITGTLIYYAGGGTGGANTDNNVDTSVQIAPLGGGGLGSRTVNGNGGNGTDGLGGGGGGGDWQRTAGSKGGSGIVIIRYRRNTGYKIGNYNGDFKIISTLSATDTDFMRITRDGASIYNPTGSPLWSTVSDKRIKENIEKASYDKCYDNINKLELYRFNYIKELHNINKDNKQLGYIAQEVEDIFPKAISTQQFYNNSLSISDLLSIDISQINYTLYGSVKKLIDMYNDIEKRVDTLEKILNIENDLHIVLPDISKKTSNSNINSIHISTINNISFYTPVENNIMMNTLTTSNIIDTLTTNTMSIYTSNNIIYDISTSNNISFNTPTETNIIIDITASNSSNIEIE